MQFECKRSGAMYSFFELTPKLSLIVFNCKAGSAWKPHMSVLFASLGTLTQSALRGSIRYKGGLLPECTQSAAGSIKRRSLKRADASLASSDRIAPNKITHHDAWHIVTV